MENGAHVVCDDVWIKALPYGYYGQPSWTTQLGTDNTAGGGCWSASWTMPRLPHNFTYPCLRRGAKVRIKMGGVNVFAGLIDSVDHSTNTITAKGYVQYASDYLALEDDGSGNYIASTTPNKLIDRAIATGWQVSRLSDFAGVGDTAYVQRVVNNDTGTTTSETQSLNHVDDVLNAVCNANGVRWGVSADSTIFTKADGTEPDYFLVPTTPIPGVMDSDFVTDLYGRYCSGYVPPTVGPGGFITANGYLVYHTAHVTDANSVALTGETREAPVDLTPLGPLTNHQYAPGDTQPWPAAKAAAEANLSGRLVLAGARVGWTGQIVPQWYQLLGKSGDPVPLWMVKAGDLVRITRVLTERGQLDAGGHRDVMVSATAYTGGATTIQLDPLGMKSRDLSAILTAGLNKSNPKVIPDVNPGNPQWFTG